MKKENLHLDKFIKVTDINIPEELFNPLKTGCVEVDTVLSELGGAVPSQVIMVTGNPGSGKTTLCSVIGTKISAQNKNRPVVFLSYEMSDFQLKMQARKIPGFNDLLISTHEFHAEKDGLKKLFAALNAIKPATLIVDSLQKMAAKMDEGTTRGQIVLVSEFTKWAKQTFTPTFLIGHNSKGGGYAGPSFLKHEVDTHLIVNYDKETGERIFFTDKNRFGGNMEQFGFKITADGVHIGSELWASAAASAPTDSVDAVETFKQSNMNFGKFQDAASSLINYLSDKHSSKFGKDTFVKKPSDVNLTWEGKRFYCQYNTGKINLGIDFFKRVDSNNYVNIGYGSERPFIKKYASTPEQAMIWAVIHEWVHLFKGYQRHTPAMWKQITKIANEEKWIWA